MTILEFKFRLDILKLLLLFFRVNFWWYVSFFLDTSHFIVAFHQVVGVGWIFGEVEVVFLEELEEFTDHGTLFFFGIHIRLVRFVIIFRRLVGLASLFFGIGSSVIS